MKYISNEDLLDKGFKIRLNYLMRESKVTTKILAEYLGVSQNTVCLWRINNEIYPALSNIEKIANYFNVKTEWLIKGVI